MQRALIALLLSSASAAFAQHGQGADASGYAGWQAREIKALSTEQIADLRAGRGMGASLPAELNGVPGPLHVLQMAARLDVTAEQRAALERITADMKASAQHLGEQVISAEAALDQAFKSGAADEAFIREASSRIATLQGRLRATHLVAHLQTRQLLSAAQVAAYGAARGYTDAAQPQQQPQPQPQHKHH
jgi:Spy/CpxP family protein refolding chaperone